MRRPDLFVFAAITTLVTLLLSAAPASAATFSDDELQDRVDAVIAEYGGVQTGENEVSWDGGAIVLTIAAGDGSATRSDMSAQAVGDCPTWSFCAYSGYSYSGSRLQFTACTSGNSVAALPVVRSIANARLWGTVRAYDGGSLVATVPPNTGLTSVAGGIDTLSCS